jgi:hypothetical protein
MKKIIKFSGGEIEYQEIVLKRGVKRIDIPKSKSNIIQFAKIMDNHKISFGLIYGTLLGAVREHNFIPHDEDTDVYVLDEARDNFLNILHLFVNSGFEIARYTNDLLSIIKDGEYIDIYFFSKHRFGYRICGQMIVKEKFLLNTIEYNFLDYTFKIPKEYEELLVYLYGNDWKTPKEDAPCNNYTFSTKVKYFLRDNFPLLVKIKYLFKNVQNK